MIVQSLSGSYLDMTAKLLDSLTESLAPPPPFLAMWGTSAVLHLVTGGLPWLRMSLLQLMEVDSSPKLDLEGYDDGEDGRAMLDLKTVELRYARTLARKEYSGLSMYAGKQNLKPKR